MPNQENALFESFRSGDELLIPCFRYYTDKNGYLNENAFRDFAAVLKNLDTDYYLICFNIDLRLSNNESTAKGDLTLRRFIAALDSYFVFRIQGEKFNIIARKEQLPLITEILDRKNDDYNVYYGVVREAPFKPRNDIELQNHIKKGIALMYEKKGEKLTDKSDIIIGGKGNTPQELQETKLRKFRSTMWFSTVTLTLKEPVYKEVTIYIFPTEYKEPLISLPIIAAVYDKVQYNVKYGSTVKFGISGVRFSATCRFDRDEHLTTAVLALDKCKFDIKTETVEGVCIPATFGKRIPSATGIKEVYPLRKNIMGFFDYVMLDDGAITVNTDGKVTTDSGVTYGITMDDNYIDLIPLK